MQLLLRWWPHASQLHHYPHPHHSTARPHPDHPQANCVLRARSWISFTKAQWCFAFCTCFCISIKCWSDMEPINPEWFNAPITVICTIWLSFMFNIKYYIVSVESCVAFCKAIWCSELVQNLPRVFILMPYGNKTFLLWIWCGDLMVFCS